MHVIAKSNRIRVNDASRFHPVSNYLGQCRMVCVMNDLGLEVRLVFQLALRSEEKTRGWQSPVLRLTITQDLVSWKLGTVTSKTV